MNTQEISSMSDQQLVHAELQLERDLIAARFAHLTSQLDDNSVMKKIRRDIARLRTAARGREITQSIPKDALKAAHFKSFAPESGGEANADGAGFLKGIVDKVASNE
jgi:ribosomal protein L29